MLIERAHYAEHPEEYQYDMFGLHWSKQKEMFISPFENKTTLIRSCNGIGKTEVIAEIALGVLDIYRPDCKVILTAETYESVKNMLWTRIWRLYKKVEHRFSFAKGNLADYFPDRENFPEWYALGLSPRIEATGEDGQAPAFQGHHSKRTVFIADESIIIDPAIIAAIEGTLLDGRSSVVYVYNPTTVESEMHKMEQEIERGDRKGNIITISAYDLFESEEYKSNPEHFDKLTNPEAVQDMIDTYGKNSPIVRARIFGEWPDQDVNAAIDLQSIYNARDRLDDLEIGVITEIVYSWDVAGEGDDSNVLGRLTVGEKGMRYEQIKRWSAEHKESLNIVIAILLETVAPIVTLVVDTIGEGSHVPSMARDRLKGVRIVSFKAGEVSEGVPEMKEVKLLNKISEGWFRAHLLLEGKINRGRWLPIAIELNKALENQLSSRKKYHKMKNKEPLVWFIEPKEDWKKRNKGKSPDEADAFIMAVFGYFNKGRGLGAGLV